VNNRPLTQEVKMLKHYPRRDSGFTPHH